MTAEQVDARPLLATALVTAIDHIGIAVADLDAAIKWYHDHLGMIVLHEEINEGQGVREAMLSVRGAPVGSAQIQLMAPFDETSTIAKFLDKRGPGLQQLAYRVSDIDTLSERLREQGVRLLYDEPRRGTADSRINFIHPKDAGGVLVELVEPAADSLVRLGPSARRAARCPVRPARRVPMAPIVDCALTGIGGPHHQVRCAHDDFLITSGAAVGLGRARCRNRAHFVFVAVGSGLDPTGGRQRRHRALPARRVPTPGHGSTQSVRTAETRRCPCRASGRSPKSRNGSRDRWPAFGPAA